MHPQIRMSQPGQCPICGMDLIPVSSEKEEVGPRQLKLSENAIKLAEIYTVPVKRREVAKVIRLSGKVEYNETNVANITSRIPGRIDNIYVNYTGINIKKGQRIVNLYSPELITAQQELLQSLKSLQMASTPDLKKIAFETVKASREKLLLWGLTKKQISDFENRGDTVHHIVIYSPMDGIVIEKNAFEGMYVRTGTKLYNIANLYDLWVKLDAYESDISWIKNGQRVEFETETFPGDVFSGKVSFIDPTINAKTRTVKVRVNVDNRDLKLKPGMFVRAKLYSKINYSENQIPLVIPASAPLITGKRAVVYVAVPSKKGVFEGREIVLGTFANGFYIVKEGLVEGENVVVNGAFKIDSDLQIQAKPSMMNPLGGGPMPGHNHGDSGVNKKQVLSQPSGKIKDKKTNKNSIPLEFKKSIDVLMENYFSIKESLSSDNLKDALNYANSFKKDIGKIKMDLIKGDSHMEWMETATKLKNKINDFISKSDIKKARDSFAFLSDASTEAILKFGSGQQKIYQLHCPMALNGKGAYWLQKDKDTRNPFFGSEMLTCQDSIEELTLEKDKQN